MKRSKIVSRHSDFKYSFNFILYLNLRFVSAAYAIVVRSSEYDLPKEILNDIVAKSISKYSGNDGHGQDARPLTRRQIDDTSVYEGE